ncbi:immunoglobulin kappa light chain-like isoform X2 [Anoplopoma fimbria]|uniref:immunoglobulin kappa light chain-like isoform X2 n=1 Tax=Anoplopoma fimbria TaxID=229290 RepID=UPI0023EB9A1A|nr:immunoglobulin kappa light chain-like isoform X2 [Anoplopoma fimbria]
MTSPRLSSYVTWLFLWKMAHATDLKFSSLVHQDRGFVSANVGDTMTLRCFYNNDDPAWLYWYKQPLGKNLKLISTVYAYDKKHVFYHEFKNNTRFTLDTENRINHLTILDLHISDSASYYCAISTSFRFTFAEGTVLSVQGSGFKVPALVHQSESETIQPGGSVTLNCTVHTGTCDEQLNVYWFKDSEESHPGLIYTHGGRNDQCERKPNTQTHTCVYNLPMMDLNLSHAGTYYCAVASCGHILFGNGTKLDFEDEVDSLVLVYFLSGALVFNTILVVLLGISVYKVNKKNSCQCSESHVRSSTPSPANTEGNRNADSSPYAALGFNLPNESRRQRTSTHVECVYSSVKQ